jgi:integrase
MVKDRRLAASPFAHLQKLNEQLDQRRVRRALDVELFRKLIVAAQESDKVFRGMAGPDRAMLYNLAGYTGYRAAELSSLTPRSFAFDDASATVAVKAAHSRKRKEMAVQVLHPDLAEMVKLYVAGMDPDAPVFPGGWHYRAAEMLRLDLDAAGIPYEDGEGVFDFHAVRGQFVTLLARAGVMPRVAQKLARHSDVNLTMRHYSASRWRTTWPQSPGCRRRSTPWHQKISRASNLASATVGKCRVRSRRVATPTDRQQYYGAL